MHAKSKPRPYKAAAAAAPPPQPLPLIVPSLQRYLESQIVNRCESIQRESASLGIEHASMHVDPTRTMRILALLRDVYKITGKFIVCTKLNEPLLMRYENEQIGKNIDATGLAKQMWVALMLPLQMNDIRESAQVPQTATSPGKVDENVHNVCQTIRAELVRARDTLLVTLVTTYDKLALVYSIDGREIRLSELLVLTVQNIELICYRLMDHKTRRSIESFCPADVPALISFNLVTSEKPISEYRSSEMYDALQQLCYEWNNISYSPAVLQYVDILRIRLTELISLEHNGWTHDVEKLRIYSATSTAEISESKNTNDMDAMYQESIFSLRFVAPTIRAVIEKLLQLRMAKSVIEMPLPDAISRAVWIRTKGVISDKAIAQDRLVLFRRWIQDKLKVMQCDGASKYLRERFLQMSMRPNEKEMFMIANPGEIPTLHAVLKTRKHEYDVLCNRADQSIGKVFESELEKEPESLEFILVLSEFLGIYFKAYFAPIEWSRFVIFEKDFAERSQDLQNSEYPLIVQCFNRMQLYFGGTMFWFNSYARSLLAWLFLVDIRFRRQLDGISIHRWYEEIEETKRRHVL